MASGSGNLVEFQQLVALVGSGNILSLSQRVVISGAGNLIELEQSIESSANYGTLITLSQTVRSGIGKFSGIIL